MSYRAKEVKKMTEFSNRMKDLKLSIGKAIGSLRFFWVDDHLEVEEKLLHPIIILKYLVIFMLNIPLAILGNSSPLVFGLNSFRATDYPTARRIIGKKEIEEAIANDKAFRKSEFEKYSWV